jgi:hypothetical protein
MTSGWGEGGEIPPRLVIRIIGDDRVTAGIFEGEDLRFLPIADRSLI